VANTALFWGLQTSATPPPTSHLRRSPKKPEDGQAVPGGNTGRNKLRGLSLAPHDNALQFFPLTTMAGQEKKQRGEAPRKCEEGQELNDGTPDSRSPCHIRLHLMERRINEKTNEKHQLWQKETGALLRRKSINPTSGITLNTRKRVT
jgi:hypothetical protein